MLDGASDDDVIAVRSMGGEHAVREHGEALATLVDRIKAHQPLAEMHILFFEYDEPALRQRWGREHLSETLPNTWPIPSPDHARHLETVS